jgi:DNA-binding MarR family transcriptional regulator
MNSELLDTDRPAITALTAAVTMFREAGAALGLLPVFLLVARSPNRTCAELARQEKISLSTMQRNLLTLGHAQTGLVQTRAEAGDARYIRHSLTEKGIALLRRMVTRR